MGLIITPALVSLIISLWANTALEERRARRDHITKLFESARDDVRRAIEAGVDYFATKPKERTPQQEARVLSADRELRAAISLLLIKDRAAECKEPTDRAREAFQSLLIELTGGNFQAAAGFVSRSDITRLVHAGAAMRTALSRLRDAELKERFKQDPVMKWVLGRMDYARKNNPFRNY